MNLQYVFDEQIGWAVRYVAEFFGSRCVEAVGIDVSPRFIWKATNWFSNPQNVKVPKHSFVFSIPTVLQFIHTNLISLKSETKFDVVFSFACLYYIVPVESMKEKIREWVKPGGQFAAGYGNLELL